MLPLPYDFDEQIGRSNTKDRMTNRFFAIEFHRHIAQIIDWLDAPEIADLLKRTVRKFPVGQPYENKYAQKPDEQNACRHQIVEAG